MNKYYLDISAIEKRYDTLMGNIMIYLALEYSINHVIDSKKNLLLLIIKNIIIEK